jgi:hypothetical protein
LAVFFISVAPMVPMPAPAAALGEWRLTNPEALGLRHRLAGRGAEQPSNGS